MTHARVLILATMVVATALGLNAEDARPSLPRIGTLAHPPIREASGLVKSKKHPGVFWTHNDSGNRPHLFAIDRAGNLKAEYVVKQAPNIDWEAITQDDAGHLYVCDVGNNFGVLPRRHVYQVTEPDVLAAYDPAKPLPELNADKRFSFGFPDRPFDVEAAFFHRGSIYLFSKLKSPKTTKLYRLSLETPAKDVKLVEVCAIPDLHVVTDASLSPDGKRLALCSYDWAARFELDTAKPFTQLTDLKPVIVRFRPTEVEGCAWDGDELILVSESREVYSLKF